MPGIGTIVRVTVTDTPGTPATFFPMPGIVIATPETWNSTSGNMGISQPSSGEFIVYVPVLDTQITVSSEGTGYHEYTLIQVETPDV